MRKSAATVKRKKEESYRNLETACGRRRAPGRKRLVAHGKIAISPRTAAASPTEPVTLSSGG